MGEERKEDSPERITQLDMLSKGSKDILKTPPTRLLLPKKLVWAEEHLYRDLASETPGKVLDVQLLALLYV